MLQPSLVTDPDSSAKEGNKAIRWSGVVYFPAKVPIGVLNWYEFEQVLSVFFWLHDSSCIVHISTIDCNYWEIVGVDVYAPSFKRVDSDYGSYRTGFTAHEQAEQLLVQLLIKREIRARENQFLHLVDID